jgi:hypothetical protein
MTDREMFVQTCKDMFPHLPKDYFSIMYTVTELCNSRNHAYDSGTRPFNNFYKALPVQYNKLTPDEYAMTLTAKQDQAFWNTKDSIKKLEYLQDGINYRLITMFILLYTINNGDNQDA